jgi:hypothetical protein
MKHRIKSLSILFICLLLTTNARAQKMVQLWVTEDFSGKPVVSRNVAFTNESVMDVLRKNADLETAFGGGFVTQINGVGGKENENERKNWFYYVNGNLARVGALAYFPDQNDNVWWDFHDWDDTAHIPSVIGAYPQPFLSGYDHIVPPTAIFFTTALADESQKLSEDLINRGVAHILVREYPGNIDAYKDHYRVLIGQWKDIRNDPRLKDMIKNSRKTGLFVQMRDDQFAVLDIHGNQARTFARAGVLVSLGSAFQIEPALWLITGTDNKEVQKVVELLVENPETIQFHSGILLSNGEIINVPHRSKNTSIQ